MGPLAGTRSGVEVGRGSPRPLQGSARRKSEKSGAAGVSSWRPQTPFLWPEPTHHVLDGVHCALGSAEIPWNAAVLGGCICNQVSYPIHKQRVLFAMLSDSLKHSPLLGSTICLASASPMDFARALVGV